MFENISGKSLIRNTWVEINLDNLKHNIYQAKDIIGKDVKLAGVLKADAYGHGAIYSAKTMIENGVEMLAVACITEAIEIRRHFPEIPILIMGHTTDEQLALAVENRITMTIYSLEQAKKISKIAKDLNKNATIHIKIDTGMNRIGFKINSDTLDIIEEIYKLDSIIVEGIFTHLALKTEETDIKQYELFMKVIDELEKRNINIPIKHICDGIAMVIYPKIHLDMVRVGSYLYGGQPDYVGRENTKPVMSFKTKIAYIKEIEKGEGVGYGYSFVADKKTLVGTLPVGYSDGYQRCLQDNGEVSVFGKRAPIIGKICMDQMMVDLTDIPEAKVGDTAVLIGEDDVDNISLLEVAAKADTNRNEILSGISRRVPKVYIENGKTIDIVDYLLD
ncbi:MAG: alanine racemase [Tissierellia bacterium]|nr:alanine racemase [Tissierellia bacterium]